MKRISSKRAKYKNPNFRLNKQRGICITREQLAEHRARELHDEKCRQIKDPLARRFFREEFILAWRSPSIRMIDMAVLAAKAGALAERYRAHHAIMAEVHRRLRCGIDEFDMGELLAFMKSNGVPEAPATSETPAPERTPHAPRGPPDDALPDTLTTGEGRL